MNKQDDSIKSYWVGLVAIVFGVALLATISFGKNPNPRVLPPNSHAYGMTYAEWSARWWQWAISMPLDHHPLADTADCSTGQVGPVWFLGGSFGASATVERKCSVPAGKAIFFPIVDLECSNLEGPPFFGATAADRRACARALIDSGGPDGSGDGVSNLFCEIDGVLLQDLTMYRVTSPNFDFVAPLTNNALGVPGGPGESVGDGYYLLLAPLSARKLLAPPSVGNHTIHFGGTLNYFNFTLDITYHLTVGP
jgi:hypothetical protein